MTREQCPVCSASDLEELILLDDYPFAGNGVVRADLSDEIPYGDLSIGICHVCGSIFQMEPVSFKDLDDMLMRQQLPLPQGETGMEVNETEHFFENLIKYAPKKGRVLDIGCGTGTILDKLKKLEYDVVGIDANPNAVKISKEAGFEVVEGRFEADMFEDESFDIIIARSVLDHTIEPSTILATMNNLLKPGGLIAIEVPNAERVFKRSAFGGFSFHHLMYWTMPTLRYGITLQGLDILGGYDESYLALFAQKLEKEADIIEPIPPTDEEVDDALEMTEKFLDRKDQISDELPDVLNEHCSRGVVILGAGTPTTDLLYYTDIREKIVHVVTSDKSRVGHAVAGSDLVIESFDKIDGEDFDAVLVSSDRRQEDLLTRLEVFLDRGGHVIRFKPDIELI